MTIWEFFYDPVLRAPTIGCMFMCLSAALTGVLVYLRKQSLVGEALSHASYPGVILGILLSALIMPETDLALSSFSIILGAFFSALIGFWAIQKLETHLKVPADAALCFILSSFFGIGLTLASRVQFTHPNLYKQSQVFLYGQAATMTDIHIVIYLILSFVIAGFIWLFYKELQTVSLDRSYANSLGIPVKRLDSCVFVLVVLSLILGIRSVGVVLMSAMLIAPAAAARQYTNKLSVMFTLAALFGLISGFAGNYFSVTISNTISANHPESKLALPTGPMIVVAASLICLLSLLLAPERGLIIRWIRATAFRSKCLSENVLKFLWRKQPEHMTIKNIIQSQNQSYLAIRKTLQSLRRNGWVEKSGDDAWQLTPSGLKAAARIVRLHRLWEVYLSDYLDMGAEKVHRSAEEMEHIITPEIEEELVKLLKDPQLDPHHQPIPPRNGGKK